MKLSLNTLLLLAILGLAVWYFFFKPVSVVAPAENDNKSSQPVQPSGPIEKTTIVKEIVKIITNGRIIHPNYTYSAHASTKPFDSFTGKVNWKGR